MRYQLIIEFDTYSPLRAQLTATLAAKQIEKDASGPIDVSLVDRDALLTPCEADRG